MKALVHFGLYMQSKSLNSASQKENSLASLIRNVGGDDCMFIWLKISQEGCQTQRKLMTNLPISSSRPYEVGEQYHYQIMCTIRLITMDYTSFKPLIVHVRCHLEVRSVIYQMSAIIFHCNV